MEFEGLHFTCPFCGEDAAVGVLGGEQLAMAHTEPYCRAFEEFTPLEYVTAVRKEKASRGQA